MNEIMKKIILGKLDTWSMSHLSQRPRDPACYIEEWWILRQTSWRPKAIKPISDFVIAWNFNLVFRQLHTFTLHMPSQISGWDNMFSFNHSSLLCSLNFIKVFPRIWGKVTTPSYFKGNINNNFLLPLLGQTTYETSISNGFCLAIWYP